MEAQIAVAKIRKYATSNSGDTVEVVERPKGGVSVVLADGQSSGRGAKWTSVLVVRKVITLLAEGVRDGAAARAASDSLFTERGGRVSATLNILSLDMQSRTLVITRNNPAPAILAFQNGEVRLLDEPSQPIGFYRDTRPVINEVSLQAGLTCAVFSDGLTHAGKRVGQPMDVMAELTTLLEQEHTARSLADALLARAMELDQNRPVDDISVVVLQIVRQVGDEVRRMSVRFPLEP